MRLSLFKDLMDCRPNGSFNRYAGASCKISRMAGVFTMACHEPAMAAFAKCITTPSTRQQAFPEERWHASCVF